MYGAIPPLLSYNTVFNYAQDMPLWHGTLL